MITLECKYRATDGYDDVAEGSFTLELDIDPAEEYSSDSEIRKAMSEEALHRVQYDDLDDYSGQEISIYVEGESEVYVYHERYTDSYVVPVDVDAAARDAGLPEDCDHEWHGVGGCTSNPGVWSTGGTTFIGVSECEHCGWTRESKYFGSQRNPGDRDTVTFIAP